HTCAVGLALQPDRLTEFMIRFDEVVTAKLDKDALQPLLWIDQVVSAEDLTHADFINGYQRLEPFGVGNPEPVFASSEEIVFENAKVVGNDHLKFTARINGSRWAGIGFGFGGFLDQVEGQLTRPAFTVRKNFFRGREEWQLNVVDISPPVTN
ncbi:MAG: hypothetical protein OEL55_01550, partial [Desulfobulbaceae bacterium]|nr:hypothetical protein [Desulfobulbaceae bacterium]